MALSRKPWYQSKTLWTNIIAISATALAPTGTFGGLLSVETVGAGLGILNIVLRLLTDKGLVVSNNS